MKPDYEKAALKAMDTLIEHKIHIAPIEPLRIVKNTEGVLVMPFADMAFNAEVERNNLIPLFGSNQDAATFYIPIKKIKYVVAYNQYLPSDMVRRGLARELGHIVLEHDGTRPNKVRYEEAMCFARHLLFPRPLIHAIQEADFPMTLEVFGSLTGCYERCIAGLRRTPGVHVPAEINRKVKERFKNCIDNFISLQSVLSKGDHSPLADFGSFMDNYVE